MALHLRRPDEDVGEAVLGSGEQLKGDPQEEPHGLSATSHRTVEGRASVPGEVADQGQDGIGHQSIVGRSPHVVKRLSARTSGHKDTGQVEKDAPRRNLEVPTKPMEPPVAGMEELFPHPLCAGAGCNDPDFPDGNRLLTFRDQAIQGLGDDLGAEAGNRQEDRGSGRRAGLGGRRSTPRFGGPRGLGSGRIPHGALPSPARFPAGLRDAAAFPGRSDLATRMPGTFRSDARVTLSHVGLWSQGNQLACHLWAPLRCKGVGVGLKKYPRARFW